MEAAWLPACMIVKQSQLALNDAADWLGDWHPLAEQLGSTDGLVNLSSVSSLLRLRPIQNVSSFRLFLKHYQHKVLFCIELPAIESAHGHATRNELRELIDRDARLARESLLEQFAVASRRVGQYQLQKLRPLRDQRLVQRYLAAVEAGQAHGWHTLVYGVTLAVYSLPLRQGLLGYAHQTTRGFIYSASRVLRMSERTCRRLLDELTADLPQAVESLLGKKTPAEC